MVRRDPFFLKPPGKPILISRCGFTLVELLILIGIAIVLLGMLLPSTRRVSEAARRTTCANNLRQIGLATHNYESANRELPMAIGAQDQDGQFLPKRISGLVTLLPFIESSPLYDQISTPTEFNGIEYPAFGPEFSDETYPPWTQTLPYFVCPSDSFEEATFGRTNYAFSIGDTARRVYQPTKLRGVFGAFRSSTLYDISDGTSNTISMSEMGSPQIKSIRGGFLTEGKSNWLDAPGQVFSAVGKKRSEYKPSAELGCRGSHWADGSAGISLINTILPPGSPSFQVSNNQDGDGVYSAGSGHSGGINVALADCSTHFVSNEIDAGDPTTATLTVQQIESETVIASPHGVWGAMGTMAGGETEAKDHF